MRDLTDRRSPGWQNQPNRLFDFFGEAARTRIDDSAEQGSGEVRERTIALCERPVEVAFIDDDSIEIGTEMHRAIEQALIKPSISRLRIVAKADAGRAPAFRHDRPAHFVEDAKRKIADLADRKRLTECDLFAEERDFLMLLQLESQSRIDAVAVFGENSDCIAKSLL